MRNFLIFASLAFLFTSCSCEPTGFEKKTYACTTDADCASGHTCVGGVCAPAVTTGGGGGGGSTGGGTGGGATGGGATGGGATTGGGGGASCADLPEVCGDDTDDNCNGILDDGCDCNFDRDCYPNAQNVFSPRLDSPQLRYRWDGGAGCAPGLQQCIDNKYAQTCVGAVTPVAEGCDGKDNDCDGVIDLNCPCQPGRECFPGAPNTNGVGVCRPGTWNCTLPVSQQCVGVNVGGVETCNGLDDDCNGLVDDGPTGLAPCAPGVCSGELKTCAGGVEVACTLSSIPGYAPTDLCGDQEDNDCNGFVDEGCACDAGATQGCFTGPASACDGGSCYGVCRRGTQTCGVGMDGGLGFGNCMNQVVPTSEVCTDSLDNDCDNLTDCADSQCAGRSCGGGRTCFNNSCQCIFDGGVSTVEICNDGVDNTCNGTIDCAEASCSGQTCGTFGKRCVGTSCQCVPDAGVAETSELTCGDGRDNDCDGLVDCADTTCAGRACATARTCIANVCTCLTDGGVPQATETSCSDGVDNDCDGVTDCADSNCTTACMTTSENCKDGIDNDGDMQIDCADSDCNHKGCSTSSAASVCCSGSCKNLGTDPLNCGVCGAVCASGTCQPSTESTRQSGRCTCPTGMSSQCPMPGPTRQTCNSTLCSCGDDNDRCDGMTSNCGDHMCSYP